MKALHKAAIIMKIALRFRKAIFGAPCGSKPEHFCVSGRHWHHTAAHPEVMPVVPPREDKRGMLKYQGAFAAYPRLLNLCGADDVLLIFQSLRFRIEIITQNRRFCKSFDKIAALVTKINYVPCFFCASYPWQLRAMGKSVKVARRIFQLSKLNRLMFI